MLKKVDSSADFRSSLNEAKGKVLVAELYAEPW